MKESKYSPYPNLTFFDGMQSEADTIKKKGIPTAITYANGVASFNGSTSKIVYPTIRLKSIRIKIKSLTTTTQHICKLSSTHSISVSSGTISATGFASPTIYVNGVVSSTITTAGGEITITTATQITANAFNLGYITNYLNGSIESISCYSSVLTTSEVANLYNSSFNMPAVPYSGQIIGTNVLTNGSFDTTVSGWITLRSTIEWKEGGYARMTKSGGTTDNFGIQKNSTLTVDKKYIVTFRAKSPTTTERPNYSTAHWTEITWIQRPYYANDWQNYIFTASTKTTSWIIYMVTGNVVDGVYVDIDDIVVQELKPTALMLFDATQGGLIDRTKLRTLTATDVVTRREGNSYSAVFNGSTSKIDTGSDFIGTKAVTVCSWVKCNSRGESNMGYILTNGAFALYLSTVYPYINFTSNITHIQTTYKYYYNWMFIVITRKLDGKVSFYIGGKNTAPAISVSADQNSGTPVAGTTNLIIGNNTGQTRTMNGSIKLLNVYEGILTIQEITQIWQETRRLI